MDSVGIFCFPQLHSNELISRFGLLTPLYELKIVDWDIDGKQQAGSFGRKSFCKPRKIKLMIDFVGNCSCQYSDLLKRLADFLSNVIVRVKIC